MTMELPELSWTGVDSRVGVFLFQTKAFIVAVGPRAPLRGWFWSRLKCLSSKHNWLQPVSELPVSPHLWGTLSNSHPLGKAAGAEERCGIRARALAPQLSPLLPTRWSALAFKRRHIGGGCRVNILLSCVSRPRPEQREYCLSARVRSAFTANTLLPGRT